jgi:hypothetical protein
MWRIGRAKPVCVGSFTDPLSPDLFLLTSVPLFNDILVTPERDLQYNKS